MDELKELPLDHVAIAVPSIADALPTFERITGARSSPRRRVAAQGVELVFVGTGDGRLELLEPLDDDSPVARFLERRGPGLHHVAYRVPDVEAALERLTDAGLRAVDERPREGAGGHRIAFLHPGTASGVLVELVEGAATRPT